MDKVPVSELCEQFSPANNALPMAELFENGAAALQSQERSHRQVEEKQKRIEFLEQQERWRPCVWQIWSHAGAPHELRFKG